MVVTSYIMIIKLLGHHFRGCTSLYYVRNDYFQPIRYGVVLFVVFVLMSLGPGTQALGLGLEHLSLDDKCH